MRGTRADVDGVLARLRVDRWTAEVVIQMRAAGIEPVLLKGPAVRRWLYASDPWHRTYRDVDLLVAPDQHRRAEGVLQSMDFTERGAAVPGEWPEHARAWLRSSDGAVVDLHRCVHGTESVPRERVWTVFAEHLEHERVAGVSVSVPDEVVRTLHVALHVDVKDRATSMPRLDLERAAHQVSREVWGQAADLARALGIAAAMGTRLRAVPGMGALADDLRLPRDADRRFEFRRVVEEVDIPRSAYAVERFADLRGSGRARYALRKVFPPPAFMRHWSPIAARGVAGLTAAYLARVAWCAGRAPAALLAWRRARRRLR